VKPSSDRICLGSARASRAGDRGLAIANISSDTRCGGEEDFGEGGEISTRGAGAPQNFRFAARGTRST
jgi:hypothetical protein